MSHTSMYTMPPMIFHLVKLGGLMHVNLYWHSPLFESILTAGAVGKVISISTGVVSIISAFIFVNIGRITIFFGVFWEVGELFVLLEGNLSKGICFFYVVQRQIIYFII